VEFFEFSCAAVQTSRHPPGLLLSEDMLPLVQNCCFAELAPGKLKIALDDGCRILHLPNGLDAAFLDTANDLLTLWLTPDAQHESGIALVQIRLTPQQSQQIEPLINAFAAE